MTQQDDQAKPRFLINAALFNLMWTPEPWQIVRFPNPSYANSLWLGTVWNFMNLPTRAWHEVIRVLFSRHALYAPYMLWMLLYTTFRQVLWGFVGMNRAIDVPIELRIKADIMEPVEAANRIKAGDARAVVEQE